VYKNKNSYTLNSRFSYNQWEATRDNYLDWLHNFIEYSKNNPVFQWNRFNLIHVTLLAKKDVEIENEWFNRIIDRTNHFSKPEKVALKPIYSFVFRYIILFLYEMFKHLVCKFFVKEDIHKSTDSDFYFHSLSSNFQNLDNITFDRHFNFAPLMDLKFNQKSSYVVTIVPGRKDIFHLCSYLRDINKKLNALNRGFVILNNYNSLRQIVRIYFSVFLKWRLFRKEFSNPDFLKQFEITKIQCADILVRQLENSFLGEIQWSLLYGLSFENWIRQAKINNPIITYGETLSPMRPVYFFSKKANSSIVFFSIQHSINNRNKIGLFHRQNDFYSKSRINQIDYSLLPDYYLVQGSQFSKLAKEFYPKSRIKIIGCLKYDSFKSIGLENKLASQSLFTKLKINQSQKIILIAPSVNDLDKLLLLFKNDIFSEWQIILRPHPATSIENVTELVKIAGLSFSIKIITDVSTSNLFSIVDLVVCGYSATCYEALMHNVPAIQFIDLNNMPLIEPDNYIPSFFSPLEFWDWFLNFDRKILNTDLVNISDKIIHKYFYKLDGKSVERLWGYLIKFKN
jgi:hypothetical protein